MFGLALYLFIGDFYQCAKFHACIKKCTIHLKFEAKAPDYKRPLAPEETVATCTYIKQCYKLFKIFNNLEVGQSFLGVVQYVQMHHPELHIIPKTMCKDDVESYFALECARVSGGKPMIFGKI